MIDVDSFNWPAEFSNLKKMFGKDKFPGLDGLFPDIDATIQRHDRIERPHLIRINGTNYCRETFAPFDQPLKLYEYDSDLKACATEDRRSITLTVDELRRLLKNA